MSRRSGFALRSTIAVPIAALVVFAAAAIAVQVSAAAPALAASSTLTLMNDGATVTTSDGQSWTMDVTADNSSAAFLNVGMIRTDTTGGTGFEEHVWYFNVSSSTLTFNTVTGVGSLNGGSQTSPVATIKLAFKATSHTSPACTSGSETVYSGTLSGQARLVTGLTGGGTIGGKKVTFNVAGATPEIIDDSACVLPTNSCVASTIFSSGNPPPATEAVGISMVESGTTYDFAGVAQKVTLSAPSGAYRDDVATQEASPAKWSKKSKVLSVTTSTSGLVTGSARLSGGTPRTTTQSCTNGGHTYKVTTVIDETATYASSAGQAITGHTSLTGDLTAPTSTPTGTYIVTTVKAV